jgi:photosystem II PsbU protein
MRTGSVCAFLCWAALLINCDAFSSQSPTIRNEKSSVNTERMSSVLPQQQAFSPPDPSLPTSSTDAISRRNALQQGVVRSMSSLSILLSPATLLVVSPDNNNHAALAAIATSPISNNARIDVNNALAREYTAFPGLFPTVASKIVKGAPYKNKKEVYAVLNDLEADRLRQYDKAIVIEKPDPQLKQFKTSQICKYECGNRVSNAYQDAQIKAVQRARSVY